MARADSLDDDLYAILGITPDFPPEAVPAVRKSLSKLYHPDSGSQPDRLRMSKINAAADVLSNREKRDAYDRARARQREEAEVAARAREREAAAAAAREQRARSASDRGAGDRFQRQAHGSRTSSGGPAPPGRQPPSHSQRTSDPHGAPARIRLSLSPPELRWLMTEGAPSAAAARQVVLVRGGAAAADLAPAKDEGSFWKISLAPSSSGPPGYTVQLTEDAERLRAGTYREDLEIKYGSQTLLLSVMLTIVAAPRPPRPAARARTPGKPLTGITIGGIVVSIVLAIIIIGATQGASHGSSTTSPHDAYQRLLATIATGLRDTCSEVDSTSSIVQDIEGFVVEASCSTSDGKQVVYDQLNSYSQAQAEAYSQGGGNECDTAIVNTLNTEYGGIVHCVPDPEGATDSFYWVEPGSTTVGALLHGNLADLQQVGP